MAAIKSNDYAAAYQNLQEYKTLLKTPGPANEAGTKKKINNNKRLKLSDNRSMEEKLDDAKAKLRQSVNDLQNSALTQTSPHPFGRLQYCPQAMKPLRALYHFLLAAKAKGMKPEEWKDSPGPDLLEKFVQATRVPPPYKSKSEAEEPQEEDDFSDEEPEPDEEAPDETESAAGGLEGTRRTRKANEQLQGVPRSEQYKKWYKETMGGLDDDDEDET